MRGEAEDTWQVGEGGGSLLLSLVVGGVFSARTEEGSWVGGTLEALSRSLRLENHQVSTLILATGFAGRYSHYSDLSEAPSLQLGIWPGSSWKFLVTLTCVAQRDPRGAPAELRDWTAAGEAGSEGELGTLWLPPWLVQGGCVSSQMWVCRAVSGRRLLCFI